MSERTRGTVRRTDPREQVQRHDVAGHAHDEEVARVLVEHEGWGSRASRRSDRIAAIGYWPLHAGAPAEKSRWLGVFAM